MRNKLPSGPSQTNAVRTIRKFFLNTVLCVQGGNLCSGKHTLI